MQCVPSTYLIFKYIHEGAVHCILGDDNPYSHYNIPGIHDGISLPSTHFFMKSIPKGKHLVDNVIKIPSENVKEK